VTSPWIIPLTGSTLGGYRLDKCIGEGGFGLVFEVTKLDTAAQFAMKVLPPGATITSQIEFENEGVLLRKLNACASVINLVDTGSENIPMTVEGGCVPLPVNFHVLALASGSLEELIVAPGTLDKFAWSERVSLWRGAVKGVHQMHLKSVAHRDLKSSNCLLMVVGTRSEVRLADLGRSKDSTQPVMHHPQAYLSGLGDFRYAPPEYLWYQGGATMSDFKNADLYGLGSLLAELATGHPMTALAMTSWSDARTDGLADLRAGVTRDLATLRPQFRVAIDGVADEVPLAIRPSVANLLTQLCDPVPHARQPQSALGRRRYTPDNGLLWLLRRADIVRRQLDVAPRRRRYTSPTTGRTA
jgi:serine/threonine protein kinase